MTSRDGANHAPGHRRLVEPTHTFPFDPGVGEADLMGERC
jgi:hypothetical protein